MAKQKNRAQQAYDEALGRIKQAGKNQTLLDLGALGLTSVPPEIGQLTNLTELYLFNNPISLSAIETRSGKLVIALENLETPYRLEFDLESVLNNQSK